MLINKQAEYINNILIKNDKHIYDLLSDLWKSFYFPSEWIVNQTSEAKWKKINATIWVALDDYNNALVLNSIKKWNNFSWESFEYAPTWWVKKLRELWKKSILEKNPSLTWETSLPIVCNWLTHCLNIIWSLFIDKNDEIISPNFFWWNYKLMFETTFWAKINTFNLFLNNCLDLDSLENILKNSNKEKIILLLNFPNNPSWYTPTIDEAQKIKNILEKYAKIWKKIVLILDDAYFGLFYEKDTFKESLFALANNLDKNILAIKIDWVSKEDYAWWLRVWFITFWWKITKDSLRVLEEKTLWIIRSSISNTSSISQEMIINLHNWENYKEDKINNYNILEERYLEVKNILKNEKYVNYFQAIPFNSWYFMSIKLKNKNAWDVRRLLLEKFDTWVISIWEDIIRIAFSSVEKSLLRNLFENIYEACILLNNEK